MDLFDFFLWNEFNEEEDLDLIKRQKRIISDDILEKRENFMDNNTPKDPYENNDTDTK